jgi:hypothetical protein
MNRVTSIVITFALLVTFGAGAQQLGQSVKNKALGTAPQSPPSERAAVKQETPTTKPALPDLNLPDESVETKNRMAAENYGGVAAKAKALEAEFNRRIKEQADAARTEMPIPAPTTQPVETHTPAPTTSSNAVPASSTVSPAVPEKNSAQVADPVIGKQSNLIVKSVDKAIEKPALKPVLNSTPVPDPMPAGTTLMPVSEVKRLQRHLGLDADFMSDLLRHPVGDSVRLSTEDARWLTEMLSAYDAQVARKNLTVRN